jgi:2-oxoglutarate ferredoxin oxidoreductase subunit gamma
MNEASLKKFQAGLRQKGLLIFDSSLIKDPELRTDIEIVGVPATKIAHSIGNAKSANMVLLGAFIAKTRLLEKNYVFDALESTDRRKKSIGVNKNALIEGMKFIEDKKG